MTAETAPAPRVRLRRRWPRLAAVTLGAVVVAAVAPAAWLSLTTSTHRYPPLAVPAAPVAIVFGAGLGPGGTLSAFLAHRVDLSIQLWRQGRVGVLLMTGDNGTVAHNEVAAMRRYALDHGVPDGAIVLDHAGFSTYDSCYRAHAVFGVTRAVLVTQTYHLPRAVATCRALGVDAVGTGVSEWRRSPGVMVRVQVRELASDAKALWQTRVSHPTPRFLGPAVRLPADPPGPIAAAAVG